MVQKWCLKPFRPVQMDAFPYKSRYHTRSMSNVRNPKKSFQKCSCRFIRFIDVSCLVCTVLPPRIDEITSMQSLHRKILKHCSVSATSSEASQPYSHNSAGQIGGGEAAVLEASGRKRCVSRVVCGTRLPCLGSCLFWCKIVIYNIQLYNMYGRGLSG